jgi:glycosyltransferase involved in cell wall biosynthesis
MSKPLRVLLIAEQCNPRMVSVPLEGWSHARAIAALPGVEAHLVTQVRNREAFLEEGLVEGKDFTAIDSEKVAARINRIAEKLRGGKGKGWTTVMALRSIAFRYFEKLLWQQFGPAIERGDFDVVHRLTPLSPTVPCHFARRCRRAGVPLVLGPINGGVPWPAAFDGARRAEREWLSYVRDAHKLLPGYRSTRRNASAIIIGSSASFAQMPRRYHDKSVYIPENAIDPARFGVTRNGPFNKPLKVVFVGRLVPYKGADMLIEAAAPHVKRGELQLEILGDGPEMPRLRSLVDQHGLQQGVSLPGWVEHTQLAQRLARSDVFGFPSIREFGGAVVLEAMSVGLVPIVVDYGGPGELVTDDTGYRLPIGTREEIIAVMSDVFAKILADPSALTAMSDAGRRRVEQHFTWPAKAAQVREVYGWVRGQRDKPDWGMPLA